MRKTTTNITNFKGIDPDNDAITLSIFEVGTNPEFLSPFITYDPVTWTLIIAPTDTTELKVYPLEVRIATTYHTVSLNFDVTVGIPVTSKFTVFEDMKLKFKAPPALVRASPYIIKLKLTDKNPSPRSLTYPLFVTVKAASIAPA